MNIQWFPGHMAKTRKHTEEGRMKKRYLILGVIAVALCFALGWSHHLWGLWGTWQGDGSLDVLGDSPLDGAVTLEF